MRVAYGPRRRTAIRIRRGLAYYLKRIAGIVGQRRDWQPPSALRQIAVVLPPSPSGEVVGDTLNHLGWYLGPPGGRPPVRVQILSTGRADPAAGQVPPCHGDFSRSWISCSFEPLSHQALDEADLILLRHVPSLLHLPVLWRHLHKIHSIDPAFFNGEETFAWERVVVQSCPREKWAIIDRGSRANFRRLLERHGSASTAYVLGTGPSLGELEQAELSGPVVVCNSIVKNTQLLDRLKPSVLCFADPVFHFGPSAYAARFREDMRRAVIQLGCFVVTRRSWAPLLLRHFPDLADRCIFLPIGARAWTVPSSAELQVKATFNILTLYMIPMAAALAPQVCIGGCDGRKPEERYFWKHSPTVQYEDLMRTAFETHPSFFRDRVYADYYEKHCHTLDDQLTTLERRGWRMASVTTSHIPALAGRAEAP